MKKVTFEFWNNSVNLVTRFTCVDGTEQIELDQSNSVCCADHTDCQQKRWLWTKVWKV